MKVYNISLASAQAANADFNSDAMQCYQMFGYSIQAEYGALINGTFKLQGSCDPVPQGSTSTPLTGAAPINWTDITNSSQAVSAAGSTIWNVTDVMYNWVRLVFTDGSGGTSTATFSARFNGKGI